MFQLSGFYCARFFGATCKLKTTTLPQINMEAHKELYTGESSLIGLLLHFHANLEASRAFSGTLAPVRQGSVGKRSIHFWNCSGFICVSKFGWPLPHSMLTMGALLWR